MSYDYGTNALGIKNPFKPEGILRAVAGLVIGILGGFLRDVVYLSTIGGLGLYQANLP